MELWKCVGRDSVRWQTCSIAEHERQRRLGHQQLRTATGGHPAGVSVRTTDVVLTACRTNVVGLQPGRTVPCRSVSERRLSPAWTVHARTLSASGNWRVCRWCGPSAANRRWIVRQLWVPTGGGCTGSLVSLPAQHCRSPKRLVDRRRHWMSNAAQLMQNGKAAGNGFLNVASHARCNQFPLSLDSVAYLGFSQGGPWRARRARAYNGGLGAEPPAGSRGRAPGEGSGAKPPWSWNTLLLNVQWKPQIRPFFWNLEMQKITNIVKFCNSCWKMAKNAPFHIKSPVKNFHGRAKGGAIAPWPSP